MTEFTRVRSSKQPARSGNRFLPHLESLEGRLLLSCDWPIPPVNCKYVATEPGGPGDGTKDNPWRSIDILNDVIATPGAIEPGDIINFRRGDTFAGNLVFNGVGGDPDNPITLTRYGPDGFPNPVINAGALTGISVRNAAGFVISHLTVAGTFDPTRMDETSHGNGIEFVSYATTPPQLHRNILLDDVNVSGFGGNMYPGEPPCAAPPEHDTGVGILIYAFQPDNLALAQTRYEGITIRNSKVHGNEVAGIYLDDSYGFDCPAEDRAHLTHERVYLHHVEVYNQQPRAREFPNDPDNPSVGGLGVSIGGVEGAVIERNVVHHNGRVGYYIINGGLGSHNSNHVLMQYNEVYATTSTADGIGMGFDRFTTNSILQYNYTHDNTGSGIMLGGFGADRHMEGNNEVRYNILRNDGRGGIWGAILVEDWTVSHVNIYGNTVYVDETVPGVTGPPAIHFIATCPAAPPCNDLTDPTIKVYNNTFYTESEQVPVVVLNKNYAESFAPGLTFLGNEYYSGGDPIGIYWGDDDHFYRDLARFRAEEGKEIYQGQPVGAEVDPKLEDIDTDLTVGIEHIDQMHDQDHLEPIYTLEPDTPDAVKMGGMNLNVLLEPDWWDPDNYFETNWTDQFDDRKLDPFGTELPENDGWSMGVSQWPVLP